MARQNTELESEEAEFLVLGQLLLQGIPSFKAYQGYAGYERLRLATAKPSEVPSTSNPQLDELFSNLAKQHESICGNQKVYRRRRAGRAGLVTPNAG